MKKTLYSLLALLMFTLGSVTAQADGADGWNGKGILKVSAATTPQAGKYYIMRANGSNDKNKVVCESGTNVSWSTTTSETTADGLTSVFMGTKYMSSVVKLVANGDGYNIQFQSGNYLQTLNSGSQATTGSADTEIFTISEISDNYYTIKGSTAASYYDWNSWTWASAAMYLDGNGNNPVGWQDATTSTSGNGSYQFFEVTLDDLYTVTYNLKDSEANTVATQSNSLVIGESFPTVPSSVEGFYTITGDAPTGTVTGNASYDFTVSYEADPLSNGFPIISSSTDDATWMKIKLRSKSATLSSVSTSTRSAINCNPGIAINNFGLSTYDDLNNTQLWCVTGNPLTGFRFHNKYNGLIIGYNGTSDGTNSIMESTSYANSYYDIVKSNDYVLAKIHGGSTYLSDWGGDYSTELKFYATIDGGSAFFFDTDTELAAADIPSYSGSYVPNFDFTSAKADATNTGATLYNAHKVANVNSSAYYKIRCSRSDVTYDAAQLRWISTENNPVPTSGELTESNYDDSKYSRTIYRVAETGADAPMLWQFEEQSTNNFKIRNANNGKYFCDPTGGQYTTIVMPVDGQYAGTYTFEPVSGTVDQWLIKYQCNVNGEAKDCYLNALSGVYSSNTNPVIQNYDGNTTSDAGNWWYIIPTTTVGLTIYSDTQYASVCYPFGVTLPETLQAYIATAANSDASSTETNKTGEVVLKSIGTSVPANKPVIIGLAEGSDDITADTEYTLTINNDATASTDGNILTGATAARTGFDEGAIYVLTTTGSEAVMRPNITSGDSYISTIPANRAYLDKSQITFTDGTSSVQGLYFSFGGNTTGIHAVSTPTTNEGSDVYYDLNGRRVLYPAHGVYVKGNGQKVFIK